MFQFYRPSRAQERMLIKIASYDAPFSWTADQTMLALLRRGLITRETDKHVTWWHLTNAGRVACAYIERPRRGDTIGAS